MKKKIIINMLSSADKVPGQGVGSAYLELVRLLTRGEKNSIFALTHMAKQTSIISIRSIRSFS